jgi:transposase
MVVMEQEFNKRAEKIRSLTEIEKVALICGQQFKLDQIQDRVEQLKCAHTTGQCVVCADKDKTIEEKDEIIKALRAKLFGKSSERRRKNKKNGSNSNKPKASERIRLPSEQYPNARIKEETIIDTTPPTCPDCNNEMTDSGLRETSERLELIPMEIFIVRMNRVRYHCKCCQCAPQTAALPARLAPSSSLNDSVLIEASIAKFYDLIPAERFAKMLSRSGLDISDKLILAAQHKLARVFYTVYLMLKNEVQLSKLNHADESPHKMLERNEGKISWYLWSFCSKTSVYFEIQNTRAGSVSIEFFKESKATVLMSDAYSGYDRTVREVNEYRKANNFPLLKSALCNDHSRRYFYNAQEYELGEKALDVYENIYKIESRVQDMINNPIVSESDNSGNALKLRQTMDPLFNQIYDLSCEILMNNTANSLIGQAANYFLNNLPGLTLFMTDIDIPISNAPAERSVRNPAVGRKTWIGTHSRNGAETSAIHYSLFESCRLNEVNPREYYNYLAQLHRDGKELITPYQYKKMENRKPPSSDSKT